MKKIILLLAIGAPLNIFSQQIILKGKIIDASTGAALPFVNIIFHKTAVGTTSDSMGFFELKMPISLEKPRISASSVGFNPKTVNILRGQNSVEIALEPAAETMREIVISGTMKATRRSESPVPIEILTPQFLRKNPTPSLFDALQTVNGVRPQLNCNVCNTGDIHINGMEGPYTMILIDGMPIVSALSTVYGLHGIPNSLVERIEIVKGPASTLYGSEAVGGLINVITKNPSRADPLSIDLSTTTYGENSADVSGRFSIGRATSLLSGSFFDFQKRWDVNGDNFTDVTLQRRFSIFNKWQFALKNDRVANIGVRYVWENRFGGELQWQPEFYGTDSVYGEAIKTNRVEIIGNYPLPTVEKLNFAYSFNVHDQKSAYGTTIFNAQQRIGFGQLTWDKTFSKRHDALFGVALRYTFLDDNTIVTADADGKNTPSVSWLPGAFAQDEITLNKKNKLLVGLRFDWNSAHGSVVSPRLNWKFSPDVTNTFRLSVGNGYRVANVFSEDHAALTGARTVVIAHDLKPEKSWNANVNWTTKAVFRNGFVGIDASIFLTHFSNKIVADYVTDANKVIFDNLVGYGISQGLTLNTDWNLENGLKILAGATLQDVFTMENGVKIPQMQAEHFSATWSASYTERRSKITIDFTGNTYGPMPLPVLPNDFRPSESPWFSIQNLQLSRKFGAFELYGGVKNLWNFLPRDPLMRPFDPFDKRAADVATNPNGYTFDTTYNYAPMQTRRVFVGVRWKIQR